VEAINGTPIYNNVEETVVSGQLQPNRGMDAALRTLCQGSRARVVLPSEQAFGVAGDGDRVKSRMVLIYDVEVLKVKKMNGK
jgi:FKBP-type peptidyl-prolyl cis-trans isomerase